MRPAENALPLRHAVALGLLQGPSELLPISSSAHTALVPWLAGWPYGELDARARKSFELALHTGAGFALALEMHGELRRDAKALDRPRLAALALAIAPAALAGATLRGTIERRLGGPRSIAAGLLSGALAMALADAAAPARERPCSDVGPLDGLALGVAQALALMPGVSRRGATLAAARARGFGRPAAHSLSWSAAMPVILGAGALDLVRPLRRRDAGQERADALRIPSAAGGAAAFASTLASAHALRRSGYGDRALLPYSLYRCLLALLVLGRLRSARAAR
jgi:undecaprenyl-diphosphatase